MKLVLYWTFIIFICDSPVSYLKLNKVVYKLYYELKDEEEPVSLGMFTDVVVSGQLWTPAF